MIEPRRDDAMIEIGDMDEDPTPSGPEAPRVVIEYRDRGIPWMLVPPLVASAVVVAVVVALGVNARLRPRGPAVAVASATNPGEGVPAATPATHGPLGDPSAEGGVPDPVVVENPPIPGPLSAPTPAPAPAPTPATGPPAAAEPVAHVEPPAPAIVVAPPVVAAPTAPPVEATAAPAAEPQVPIGFNPALLDDPLVPAPAPGAPVDPSLAAAGQGNAGAPAAAPAPELPTEVDADLIPPDPRQSLADRYRRAAEARREVELERGRYHADLARAFRQFGANRRAAAVIKQINQEYGQDVPPAAIKQAKKELGPTGRFVGASTGLRIKLLRALGFPETAILDDILAIDNHLTAKDARSRPHPDDMLVRAAMTLLRHPPGRAGPTNPGAATAAARPVSAPATSTP